MHAPNVGFPRGFPDGDDPDPMYSRSEFLSAPVDTVHDAETEAASLPEYVKAKIEKF